MKRDLHVYLYEYQWNHGGMLCMQCGLYSCVLVSFVGLFSYMRWKETYKRDQHTWNAIADGVAQNLEIICKNFVSRQIPMKPCGHVLWQSLRGCRKHNLSEDATNTISQRICCVKVLREILSPNFVNEPEFCPWDLRLVLGNAIVLITNPMRILVHLVHNQSLYR